MLILFQVSQAMFWWSALVKLNHSEFPVMPFLHQHRSPSLVWSLFFILFLAHKLWQKSNIGVKKKKVYMSTSLSVSPPFFLPVSHHPDHDVGEWGNPQGGRSEGQHEPVVPAWGGAVGNSEVQQQAKGPGKQPLQLIAHAGCKCTKYSVKTGKHHLWDSYV